jgi:hypothetical protein
MSAYTELTCSCWCLVVVFNYQTPGAFQDVIITEENFDTAAGIACAFRIST